MRPPTRLAAALFGVVLVAGAAACAPGGGGSDEDSGGDGTIDPSTFQGKTLDYVYFTDGPDEQATRDAVEQFEQETGATVNLQIVPFDNLEQQLQARINAGNAPEVARTHDWRPYSDVLLDFKGYFGEDYDTHFIDGMARASLDEDGAMRAVPSDLTMNGPLVNVDAFKKAGVPLPTAKDPWTWAELVAAGKQVRDANGMSFAVALDKSGHRVSTVLSQYGTVFFDDDGQPALDDAKAEEALSMLNDLMQSDDASKDFWLESGSRYEGANEMFLAEDVPIYLTGNWQVGLFKEDATFDWAAVPNPCEERCGGFPGGKYMVAFSGSDEPELGAYFVDWMNQPEQQEEIDRGAYWLPTRTDLVEQGIEYADRGRDMEVFLADVRETPDDTYSTFTHPQFTTAADELIAEFDKTVAGQQDLATTVANLNEELATLAEDAG